MKRRPMDNAQLLAAIKAEEDVAIGGGQDAIAADRRDAIDRYLGRAYGDEIPGRSSVVSRDVADVVEGVLANVLKPFVAGDELCRFDPIGPEDEDQAQQESDYINHVVGEKNNGYLVLAAAVKDALLLRNGYIGIDWRVRDDVRVEPYRAMSDEEVAVLMEDSDVEVIAHSEYPGGDGMLLHDIHVKRKRPTEYAEIVAIPPDEMLIGERTRDPGTQNADFIQRRKRVSISSLREQGYEVADEINDDDDGEGIEEQSRQRFGNTGNEWDDQSGDPARRLVTYKETWLTIDRNGDGVAELLRVCQVGQTLLSVEDADIVPIASGTGVLMQHQHLGLSVYDMIEDLAKAKTALLRQYLDNQYIGNNQRIAIDQDRVNLADLQVSRPGGIIRCEGTPMDAMVPVPYVNTGASALQGLEYLDSVRENRSGYTRYAQGMGSDSLMNKTATGLMQATNQSQTRLEMIARTLAETLVKDLFRLVHAVTIKHGSKAEKIRLRNKWVLVDPRTWVRRSDLSIAVGLGVGTGDQQLMKLQALAPMLAQAGQLGLAGAQEFYSFGVEVLKAAGYKNPDKFLHPPPVDAQGKPLPPPPPPDDPLVASAKVKAQAEGQSKQMDLQADAQKFQAQATLDQRKMEMEFELQRSNDERAAALQMQKHQDEMQLQRERMLLEAQTKIEVAKIGRGVDWQMIETTRAIQDSGGKASQMVQMASEVVGRLAATLGQLGPELEGSLAAMREQSALMSAPKRIVRGADGKAIGIETARLQ